MKRHTFGSVCGHVLRWPSAAGDLSCCHPQPGPIMSIKGWCHEHLVGRANRGSCTHPLGLENADVICCFSARYLKNFVRALIARHGYHIRIFQSKTSQKYKNCRLRIRCAEKWSIFCTAHRKRVNFLMCWWVCPPPRLWEKFCGRPCTCIGEVSRGANCTGVN